MVRSIIYFFTNIKIPRPRVKTTFNYIEKTGECDRLMCIVMLTGISVNKCEYKEIFNIYYEALKHISLVEYKFENDN